MVQGASHQSPASTQPTTELRHYHSLDEDADGSWHDSREGDANPINISNNKRLLHPLSRMWQEQERHDGHSSSSQSHITIEDLKAYRGPRRPDNAGSDLPPIRLRRRRSDLPQHGPYDVSSSSNNDRIPDPEPASRAAASEQRHDQSPLHFPYQNRPSSYSSSLINGRQPRTKRNARKSRQSKDPNDDHGGADSDADSASTTLSASLDSDEELEATSRQIRLELRHAEMLELAAEAERAAAMGKKSFTGRASTFGKEDLEKVDLKKPAPLFRKSRSTPVSRRRVMASLDFGTPIARRSQKEPTKIGVLALRDVNEVFPSFKDFHIHLRTHLARKRVSEQSLVFQEQAGSSPQPPPRPKLVQADTPDRRSDLCVPHNDPNMIELMSSFHFGTWGKPSHDDDDEEEEGILEQADDCASVDTLGSDVGDLLADHMMPTPLMGSRRVRKPKQVDVPPGLHLPETNNFTLTPVVAHGGAQVGTKSQRRIPNKVKSRSSVTTSPILENDAGTIETLPTALSSDEGHTPQQPIIGNHHIQDGSPNSPFVVDDSLPEFNGNLLKVIGSPRNSHSPPGLPLTPRDNFQDLFQSEFVTPREYRPGEGPSDKGIETPKLDLEKKAGSDFFTPVRLRDIRCNDFLFGNHESNEVPDIDADFASRANLTTEASLPPGHGHCVTLPNGDLYHPSKHDANISADLASMRLQNYVAPSLSLRNSPTVTNALFDNTMDASSVMSERSHDSCKLKRDVEMFEGYSTRSPGETFHHSDPGGNFYRDLPHAMSYDLLPTRNDRARIDSTGRKQVSKGEHFSVYDFSQPKELVQCASMPIIGRRVRDADLAGMVIHSYTTNHSNGPDEPEIIHLENLDDVAESSGIHDHHQNQGGVIAMEENPNRLNPMEISLLEQEVHASISGESKKADTSTNAPSDDCRCECLISPASSLDSEEGLYARGSALTGMKVPSWNLMETQGRATSPSNSHSASLNAAVAMLSQFSHRSQGSRQREVAFAPPKANDDFMSNYLYCSKRDEAAPHADPICAVPCQETKIPCGDIAVDSCVGGFLDSAMKFLPKKSSKGAILSLSRDKNTELHLHPDSWYDRANERFDGFLERLIGTDHTRGGHNTISFQAPALKEKGAHPSYDEDLGGVVYLPKSTAADDLITTQPLRPPGPSDISTFFAHPSLRMSRTRKNIGRRTADGHSDIIQESRSGNMAYLSDLHVDDLTRHSM